MPLGYIVLGGIAWIFLCSVDSLRVFVQLGYFCEDWIVWIYPCVVDILDMSAHIG